MQEIFSRGKEGLFWRATPLDLKRPLRRELFLGQERQKSNEKRGIVSPLLVLDHQAHSVSHAEVARGRQP